ncbi:MAG TPA: 5'-3' exonuclease H3TH domain-containing protein, partial [Rhizomicrobium sp.]|nr:5'-3' exonuclease H3TH domain-containing protein [Rhizomicrobium sp.]
MSALKKGDHLYLVDGSGYLFRAYHALPPLTRKSDGLPVGAVSGYCNMLWKLLEDMKGGEAPTHLAVIFDAGEKTFRNDIYKEYKANRPPPPEDLIPQFPLVRDATRAFGVSCVELAGYEADDLIATYARLAREAGARCTIISSDKDLMQLVVDGKVELLDTMKNRRLASAEVLEKFGVAPDKVIHVQALAGDSIDNVPGVRGIGIKTAAQLISEYGDLESLLGRAAEIKQPKRREALIENAGLARISKQLVTLVTDVELTTPLDDLRLPSLPAINMIAFFKALEFTTITRRVAELYGVEAGDIEADERLKIGGTEDPRARMPAAAQGVLAIGAAPSASAGLPAASEEAGAAEPAAKAASAPVPAKGPTPITLAAELQAEAASG